MLRTDEAGEAPLTAGHRIIISVFGPRGIRFFLGRGIRYGACDATASYIHTYTCEHTHTHIILKDHKFSKGSQLEHVYVCVYVYVYIYAFTDHLSD